MFTLSVGPTGIWTSGLPLGEPSPIELTGRLTKVFEIEKLLQAVDRKAKGDRNFIIDIKVGFASEKKALVSIK